MRSRIIKNWKTTAIASAIFTVSLALLVLKYVTWDQCVGFWVTSGLLTWVRDSIFKVNPENDTTADNQ